MSVVSLGTKAETLERLEPYVTSAKILPQVRLTAASWGGDPETVLMKVRSSGFGERPLIVRSSSRSEDDQSRSLAGHFVSVLDVRGEEALVDAIDRVVASFGESGLGDQVFVQPMLEDVALAGVAFSFDPSTGSPYAVINYDDTSRSTFSVTGGASEALHTCYWYRPGPVPLEPPLDRVGTLLSELEALTGVDELDVEFAITSEGDLYLLQVRHLTGVAHRGPETSERVTTTLADVARKVRELGQRHPYLHGDQTIFGNMPDWNPAEIVGVRPRPLAMSLYRELVTDSIWAYQRDNYGYRNLRSFPLLVSLAGLPYIDVRVSFNSFLPKDLDQDLAERLSSYYIDRLRENPSNHDKVEFEIIYTCYTLDLPSRLRPLLGYGFSDLDLERLTGSLRRLTNRIIHGETGLWRGDIAKLEQLEQRFDAILGSGLDGVAKIYWLLEDCKRYGTLPFAGLARAGFIAVQLLRSLVAVGIFDSGDYDAFMSSLDTISSRMARDLAELNNPAFLRKYGYLRPGTYDIRSPRYDEAKDRYFDWSSRSEAPQSKRQTFQLSLDQLRRTERLLKEHGLEQDLLGLFDFIKAAIEGREYAKFVFSRSLSEALTLFRELGAEHGLSLEDCSFVDICTIARLYGSSADPCRLLVKSAEEGREAYAITCRVVLPPLITGPDDVYRFELPPTAPNFITQKGASGPVTTTASPREALHGSVLLIPSADPGYDWVFSHGIGAFVTMYGGVNSHMAIRAAELGIPAVIGAGQTRFDRWVKAEILEIDCANRQVRVVQ